MSQKYQPPLLRHFVGSLIDFLLSVNSSRLCLLEEPNKMLLGYINTLHGPFLNCVFSCSNDLFFFAPKAFYISKPSQVAASNPCRTISPLKKMLCWMGLQWIITMEKKSQFLFISWEATGKSKVHVQHFQGIDAVLPCVVWIWSLFIKMRNGKKNVSKSVKFMIKKLFKILPSQITQYNSLCNWFQSPAPKKLPYNAFNFSSPDG